MFQRQVLLSHAGYPLINEGASGKMTPLPDYWIALVHKRTMGAGVLGVSSSVETVRAYAHCAAAGAGGASDGSDGETNANSDSDGDAGGVTLALLNINTCVPSGYRGYPGYPCPLGS